MSANVWPLSEVSPHVDLEICSRCVCLFAALKLAGVLLYTVMYRFLVIFQGVPAPQCFFTLDSTVRINKVAIPCEEPLFFGRNRCEIIRRIEFALAILFSHLLQDYPGADGIPRKLNDLDYVDDGYGFKALTSSSGSAGVSNGEWTVRYHLNLQRM